MTAMREEPSKESRGLRLRLPATSANLGPAFDTAAVALDMHLELKARPAAQFSIEASGQDAEACGRLEGNLIVGTYCQLLKENGREASPLQLQVNNEIPLGMGCGSSAAARLAGIALAVHFGGLAWQDDRILAAASSLEGHPDNVSACWLGGMTISAVSRSAEPCVHVARLNVPDDWRAFILLPEHPIHTKDSRRVLPDMYSRADATANVQRTGLLVAAVALGRGDLLQEAMRDWMHQPYRAELCPLLDKLLPLAGTPGILGAALSGAGPAVLLIVEKKADDRKTGAPHRDAAGVHSSLNDLLNSFPGTRVLACDFQNGPATREILSGW